MVDRPPWELDYSTSGQVTPEPEVPPWELFSDGGVQVENPQPQQPPQPGFTDYFNQGIAGAVGSFADLLNAGLGVVGLGTERPFGGSKSIAAGLESLGIRSAPQDHRPDSLIGSVGQGIGSAAGSLIPGVGVVSALRTSARPAAQALGQFLAQPFRSAPAAALATDAASGAAFGAAEYGARSAGGEGFLPTAAGVAGGVAAGMTPALAATAIRNSPTVGIAVDMGKAAIAPFTDSGALVRARGRVQGMAEDPAAALSQLQEQPISGLSPAARTGDPRLMQLEQAVRRDYAPVDMSLREAEAAAANTLRSETLGDTAGASIGATRQQATQRLDALTEAMNARVAEAEQRAAERVSALEPSMRQSQASGIVRQEMEAADAAARAEQNRIWSEVPDSVRIPTGGLRKWLGDVVKELPKADRDKVPAKAVDIIQRQFGKEEPVSELHALYSDMREVQRNALAGDVQNRQQARIAGQVADRILKEIDDSASGSQELRAAIDYSRKYNETFRRGTVGRILSNERTGGERVPAIETLDRSIGRPGLSGVTGYDEIARALGGGQTPAQGAMSDYILSDFRRGAVRRDPARPDRDILVPQQTRRFLEGNQDMMDRMPGVRNRIASALTETERAGRVSGTMGSRKLAISSPDKSAAALLTQSRPGNEVESILRSNDPASTAGQLMRQARKDKTGEAARGLKNSFLDDLLQRGSTGSYGPDNKPLISGRAMIARLDDPKYADAAREVIGPDGLARARKIANEFAKLESVRGASPSPGPIMGDEPNSVIAYAARVVAARMGASAGQGGASLQTAQMASNRMKRLLQRLTNDKAEQLIKRAVEGDVELFESLLTPVSKATDKAASMLENALRSSTAGAVGAASGQRQEKR